MKRLVARDLRWETFMEIVDVNGHAKLSDYIDAAFATTRPKAKTKA
jgi:hypothetical protein